MLKNEAAFIAQYLIHTTPPQKFIERYESAHKAHGITLNEFDARLWALACRSRSLLYFIDSGCSVMDAHHPIRNKLFLMLGILEASPEYADFFIPKKIRYVEIFKMTIGILKAGMAVILGLILIIVCRVLWK